MQGLRTFSAGSTPIEQLPDSFGGLINLEGLYLSYCKNLRNLPNSIWKLKSLKELDLHVCSKLERLPEQLGKMQCLERLIASNTAIEEVPDSIGLLSRLRRLLIGSEKLKCTSLGFSLSKLPLNLENLHIYNLEQLPDLSSLRKLEGLYIRGCTSLQDLPDLSMLKELRTLQIEKCSNLKSISLKPSSLQVGQPHLRFSAHLPNREVPEWFNYKSSGLTVSFDIPPSFGSNFLGLALWVVYTCKATDLYGPLIIRAVITNRTEGITVNYSINVENNTESITKNYPIDAYSPVSEEKSRIQCITGEKISMKSGDRIKVSIGETLDTLMYFHEELKVPIGEVKVKMFGVHMIQDGPSTSI